MTKGSGYTIRFSPLFGQEMAYMAVRFNYQGGDYVLPYSFSLWTNFLSYSRFSINFPSLGVVLLLLFSFLAWFIIHFLKRPVSHIIQAIKPYQLGKAEHISEIKLGKQIKPNDELASLLKR